MSGLIGERFDDAGTPRYIAHPTAGAGWVLDGKPIDSGSVYILDNNCSHLSHEALRHWVTDAGPGTINYQDRGYVGLNDRPEPDGAFSYAGAAAIAWDRRTATRYGPFASIADAPVADRAGFAPRPVRVVVDASAGAAGSLQLHVALTIAPSTEPPSVENLAYTSTTLASGGRQTATLDLAPTLIGAHFARVNSPCRPVGTRGTVEVALLWVYLWVGWYSGNGADAVVSVSAFERRA